MSPLCTEFARAIPTPRRIFLIAVCGSPSFPIRSPLVGVHGAKLCRALITCLRIGSTILRATNALSFGGRGLIPIRIRSAILCKAFAGFFGMLLAIPRRDGTSLSSDEFRIFRLVLCFASDCTAFLFRCLVVPIGVRGAVLRYGFAGFFGVLFAVLVSTR
jgi:hypothetical protein